MKSHKYLFIKVFIPFFIAFVIIGAFSLFSLDKLNNNYQKNRTKDILLNIERIYESKINENNNIYKELLHNIKNDKTIAKLYLQKNRKALYDYTKDTYLRLNKSFGITHFYFHDLDSRVFLRVHNYKKHSDKIDRFTLKKAQNTLKDSVGIEFGIAHNLTSRYVTPYFIKGKLVGFLELGEEVDYMTQYLSNILNAQILVAIKKDLINLKNIRLTSKLNKQIKNYPETAKYYIINSTIENIDDNIKNLIDKDVDIFKIQKNISINYEIGMLELYDIEKRNVGEIIVLINTQEDKINLLSEKTKLSTLIFLVGFFIVSTYFVYVKGITKKLDKSTEDIIKLTNIDQLTSLYNRRYFNEIIPQEIQNAINANQNVSFIMIDIDDFKKYNDNYGHLKGDIVLKEVSKILLNHQKRANDIAFRMGGEEFALFVIERENQNSAINIAEQIRKEVFDLNIEHKMSQHKKITLSIGITTQKATKNLEIDELYKQADEALYKAKETGKNKLHPYMK